MLFATSFGDAVANPDPMQLLLGAGAVFLLKFLSTRFSWAAALWAIVGKLLNSNAPAPVDPVNPPAPVDPIVPANHPLRDFILEMVRKILEGFDKKQAEAAAQFKAEVVAAVK